MTDRDISGLMVSEAESLAAIGRPLAVSVLVASRDPEVIAWAGPRTARALYPGRSFGSVIHHQPHPDPDWTGELFAAGCWSEVIVTEGETAP